MILGSSCRRRAFCQRESSEAESDKSLCSVKRRKKNLTAKFSHVVPSVGRSVSKVLWIKQRKKLKKEQGKWKSVIKAWVETILMISSGGMFMFPSHNFSSFFIRVLRGAAFAVAFLVRKWNVETSKNLAQKTSHEKRKQDGKFLKS